MELYEISYVSAGRCQGQVKVSFAYPLDGVGLRPCYGTAVRGMTWEGRTEGTHRASLCDACTLRMLGPMIGPEIGHQKGA